MKITKQLEHNEYVSQLHNFPITLVCDDIKTPENIGMVFRLAEAFGVDKIILCGLCSTPPNTKIRKTARSCEKTVKWHFQENIEDAINILIEKSHHIIALELTNNSFSLPKCDFNINKPIALIIGSEAYGISKKALRLANAAVEIPMYGNNSSMNVATAVAIALYEITNQLS